MNHNFPGFIVVKYDGSYKEYAFGTQECEVALNSYVVVENERGQTLAKVYKQYQTIDKLAHDFELKPFIRVANAQDIANYKHNKIKAFDAKMPIEKAIAKFNLEMRISHIEYTLDAKKILITYVSENRVDFRELLKELTTILKCRIELKQIGQRDKAKMVGGIGVCGRKLCCASHLQSFDTITINMAKNQQLTLNTGKLSGQCGKLKCCLRYENEQYTEAKQGLPKLNSHVVFQGVEYKLTDINLVSKQVTLRNANENRVLPFHEVVKEANHDSTKEL